MQLQKRKIRTITTNSLCGKKCPCFFFFPSITGHMFLIVCITMQNNLSGLSNLVLWTVTLVVLKWIRGIFTFFFSGSLVFDHLSPNFCFSIYLLLQMSRVRLLALVTNLSFDLLSISSLRVHSYLQPTGQIHNSSFFQ